MVLLSGGMRQEHFDAGTAADFGIHGQCCSQQLRTLAYVLLSVVGPVILYRLGGVESMAIVFYRQDDHAVLA